MIPLLLVLLVARADDPPLDSGAPSTQDEATIHPDSPHRPPGQAPGTPPLQVPLPFDHGHHAKTFASVRVACADCHPIGLTTRESGSFAWPGDEVPHPYNNCHGCHQQEYEGAPRNARGLCLTCHLPSDELIPESHDLGWLDGHGLAARSPDNDCELCHTSSRCIACHDERGALSSNPHGPGFMSWHGIEARLDPRKCSTCHEAQTCQTCHEQGSLPW